MPPGTYRPMKPLYYEDTAVGSEIPPLVKKPTPDQLLQWAEVSGDHNPIHFDEGFARSRGLPGIIVQGQLVFSSLGQLLSDWTGEQGVLLKLSCSYKGMNFPEETLTCRGKVIKQYTMADKYYIDCSLWVENPQGEKTLSGTATVSLPHRE